MPNWIVYIVSIFSFLPSVVDSQSQWTTIGTNAMVTYHSGYILASATDANGNVYVVGDFYNSNNCQYVAKWTKSTNTWAELGGITNNIFSFGGNPNNGINTIALDNSGNVYIAGFFSNSNGNRYVAKWTNSTNTWAELGGTNTSPFNSAITNIALDANNNVYVAGWFQNSKSYRYIGVYNVSTNKWGEVGGSGNSTFNNYVDAVKLDASNNIYIAGKFTNANGKYYVAKWNGTAWGELGGTNTSTFNSEISCLAIDNSNNVYATGYFNNSVSKKYVAKWDGSSWTETGGTNSTTFNNQISCLLSDGNGSIYASGTFNNSSNVPAIYRWDGSVWSEACPNYSPNFTNGIPTICQDNSGNLFAFGNGSGLTTFTEMFTPVPTISSFSPTAALKGATVTITGTYLSGATSVTFGGTTVSSFTVVNSTTLQAVVGTGSSGLVGVTTPLGSATPFPTFTYLNPPKITYSSSTASYLLGTAITSLVPTNTGGLPKGSTVNVTTFAGGTSGYADGTGTAAKFNQPQGLAIDANGNIYVADYSNNRIRKITAAGVVSTFAGNGTAGFVDGAAISAQFNNPVGLAIDASGNLYVGDSKNHRIRKITQAGVVSTLAGSGSASYADGMGTSASFNQPQGVAVDVNGNVYVADYGNFVIRKVTSAGVVTTFAGKAGSNGNVDGSASTARFGSMNGVAVTNGGYVYVVDGSTQYIRQITPSGYVTTIAGNGSVNNPANGTGTNSSFSRPYGVTVDNDLQLYIGESSGPDIRKITNPGFVTSTYAGIIGSSGFVDGVGTSAKFKGPNGCAFDSYGNLYVADQTNNAIRKISPTGYSISPSLPTGLSMDAATGIISGTPTIVSAATNYVVTATNASGSSSFTLNIKTVLPPPSISTFSPSTASVGGSVTITGQYFTGATSVTFGNVPASSFTVNSDNSITAIVGGGATGAVTVTTPYWTKSLSGFTYQCSGNVWNGNTNTDWNTASNWCAAAVPLSGANITIGGAVRYPILSSNVQVGNVSLYSGTSLSLNGNTFTISGTVSGTGQIIGSPTSSLIVNSTVGNTLYFGTKINDSLLSNLTIGGSGNLTLGSGLGIVGTLNVNAGSLSTGNHLSLKSTSIANTGIVGKVNGTISGNVTVERYIPMELRTFRDIAPGVTSTTGRSVFTDWQESGNSPLYPTPVYNPSLGNYGIYITGGGVTANNVPSFDNTTGFDKSYTGNPSMYLPYTGPGAVSWPAVTNTKTLQFDAKRSYRVLIRGNRSFNIFTTPQGGYNVVDGPGPMQSWAVLRSTGSLATGTITIPASSLSTTMGNFVQLGNPYVCPIVWDSVVNNSTGILGSFWYLDPTVGNGDKYVVYNSALGTNNNPIFSDSSNYPNGSATGSSVNKYLQPGQGFFVKTTSASPSITYKETFKILPAQQPLTSVFGNSGINRLSVSLWRPNSSNVYRNVDGAVSVFSPNIDASQSSEKVFGPEENISIYTNHGDLSIDARKPVTINDTLVYKVSDLVLGTSYKLKFNSSEFYSNGLVAGIYDNYTKAYYNIGNNDTTVVSFFVTSDVKSQGNRFILIFKPVVLSINDFRLSGNIEYGNAHINLSYVGDATGSAIELEKSTDGVNFFLVTNLKCLSYTDKSFSRLAYYKAKATSPLGKIVYSNVLEIKEKVEPSIEVYPNPVKGGNFQIKLNNFNNGKYVMRIIDAIGKTAYQCMFDHLGVVHSYEISAMLENGNYIVNVVAENGNIHKTNLLFVK